MKKKKGTETMPNPEVKTKANRRRFGKRSKWPELEAIGIRGNRCGDQ